MHDLMSLTEGSITDDPGSRLQVRDGLAEESVYFTEGGLATTVEVLKREFRDNNIFAESIVPSFLVKYLNAIQIRLVIYVRSMS